MNLKKMLWKWAVEKIAGVIYWDRINPKFMNVSRIHFLSLKYYVTSFVDRFVKKDDYVLDFWCGNMIYKDLFLQKTGIDKYYWIDIGDSPENKGNYIVYDWWQIPFPDDHFNIVTCTQVFEHLQDIKLCASELERITMSGGHILVTIAHVWEYHPYPKHYQNVMLDLIPEIFRNSEILEVRGDTSEFENLSLFLLKYLSKKWYFGLVLVGFVNLYIWMLDKLWLSKIGPKLLSPYAGNILLVLNVTK